MIRTTDLARAACVATALFAGPASAAIVFPLDMEFSGAVAPAGSGPWITLTFQDSGPGQVDLTIQANLSGPESARYVYFNVLPSEVSNPLSQVSIQQLSGPVVQDMLRKSANPLPAAQFKADGDGFFDFRLDWAQGALALNQSASFRLSAPGMNETWFNDWSEPGGSNGSYNGAAHILSTGPGGLNSGWIGNTVPAPSAAALLALAGLGASRRRRRSS